MSKKECGRIKNLRNSLSKAYKSGLMVEEVPKEYLVESNQRVCIDEGIAKWKESKKGIQIASTTVNPWLDIEHRRYWLARLDSTVVGILILTPIHHGHWQIVNVVPFNSSPKGTSEALIHAVLKAIEAEQDTLDESTSSLHSDSTGDSIPYPNYQISIGDATSTPGLVSFGISATQDVVPRHNPSPKLETLVKIYNKVAYLGGLFGRKEFRSKFDPKYNIMYVCYPRDAFDKGSRFSLFEDLINALRK
ncbi:hypothetical protein JR316_0013246 [Psilocybe cubensis]|uniref:Uncharacterized protein n=1 Tax=Psilocybe cubensis TaxID=181762 RepID=A0ACB8GGX2_PSICU|nr:hypothetical protein JR316_0013246 [Psilocybe cubensis]KAH9474781.1 hypothetical protein JR316_0013246 [Psilocybe cubensis]